MDPLIIEVNHYPEFTQKIRDEMYKKAELDVMKRLNITKERLNEIREIKIKSRQQ
jgi:hypothetical protein